MPAPTKHVSAVTPSRVGMPGGALSAWRMYSGSASSTACTPSQGIATLPLTMTRGLPGIVERCLVSSSIDTMRMAPIVPHFGDGDSTGVPK